MAREMIVLPYSEKWKEDFQQIKDIMLSIFKDIVVDIQHFGSTSIEGMSAKPIIDVMIIVNDIQKVDDFDLEMKKDGYIPKGENGISGRRYYQYYHEDGYNHTQHIHIYEKDNPAVKDQLMFRDYLQIDKEAFEQYEKVKIQASIKFRYSPKEYTEYKTDCISEIIKKAKLYFSEKENYMREIIRSDVNEEWAHSGIVEAGDFVFINYCVGNIGQPIENQINGAFDHLSKRLESIGLTIESVVKIDCLFRDVWNIPVMEKVIKERFNGKYPARKSIQTEFAHRGGQDGLLFQLDAIAFKG